MANKEGAARALGGAAGGGNEIWTAGSHPQPHYTRYGNPVALVVRKRGRECVVGKVVPLDGELVLAVAVRNQQGTATTVSMPVVAMDYAERNGCRWLYHRDDRRGVMRRIRLENLRRLGWLATSDGIAEQFVRLGDMELVSWRRWSYVEDTLLLEPERIEEWPEPAGPSAAGTQLRLL